MPELKSKPLVSVIVLNYNGKWFLERCLNSVLSSNYPNFEVIFVDNASIDGSVELVKEKFGRDSRLKIIQNERNFGFAKGNNIGARNAMGDYVVFLNNDTEVDPCWLNDMVEVMESDLGIGACQSKLLLMSDRKRFDCAGGLLDYLGFPLGRGDFEEDKGQFNRVEEVFHAKGAAMTVRREVLREVGIFDPSFMYYYDEIDLCWRIRLRGYKVVFVPTSIVYHSIGSSTVEQPSPLKAFHATKNHLIMLIKNYSFRNIISKLPIVVFLRAVESFLLLRRETALALAKVSAMLWVLKNIRYVWSERVRVQHCIRRVPDSQIMKYMRNIDLTHLHGHFLGLYSS